MNNNEGRQTAIMSDKDALTLQQTLSHASKGKKHKPPGVRKTAAAKKNAADGASVPTNKNGEAMMYYEEDNLRIPLLDKNGRTKTARSAKTLYTKIPKPELLATVREYAGEAKVKELEKASKSDIADWINEVETRAFGGKLGSSSKPRSDKKRKNPDSATSLQQQLKKLKLKQTEFESVSQAGYHAELTEQASNEDDEFESLVQDITEQLNEEFSDGPPDEGPSDKKMRSMVEDHQVNDFTNVSDKDEERLSRQKAFQANIMCIARGEHQHITTVTQKPPKYLKPGKHGYDYENDRWYFEGDPDLYTGIGHDVEPADEERLAREGDLFRGEFSEKYPGYLSHQWPCGCHYPLNDSDSDWEDD